MKVISAKEIVARFNIPYYTLNYYTVMGLLPVRDKKGYKRVYDEEEVRQRLETIRSLSSQGYPLNLIRKKINGHHALRAG